MESGSLLACSQDAATGRYPEPEACSSQLITLFLRSILKLYSHLRLGLQSRLFPSDFRTKIVYAFLISLMRAKCPANFIPLDLITLIMFGEAYTL
jgi:hypothetical protein